MPTHKGIHGTVDDYIAISRLMFRLSFRRYVKQSKRSHPTAEETISYRMPAFKLNGTLYLRTAFGKSFNQGMGLGRQWTPTIEFVANRDLLSGARTKWDVVPEFQVTLSSRQHVRVALGYDLPLNEQRGVRLRSWCMCSGTGSLVVCWRGGDAYLPADAPTGSTGDAAARFLLFCGR